MKKEKSTLGKLQTYQEELESIQEKKIFGQNLLLFIPQIILQRLK